MPLNLWTWRLWILLSMSLRRKPPLCKSRYRKPLRCSRVSTKNRLPPNIVIGILSKLMPQEGVAESEPGYEVDPGNAPIKMPEVDVEGGRPEDEPTAANCTHRGGRVLNVSSHLEDQVKGPSFEPLFQTPSALKSAQGSSSRPYDCYVTKRPHPSSETPLNCIDHPFFEDILKISEE